MILHVATFVWKDEVTDAVVAELTEALAVMATKIPALESYTAGPNLHLQPNGKSFGVVALVADAAALTSYLEHPDHVAVVDTYLSWMVAERAAVQLDASAGGFAKA